MKNSGIIRIAMTFDLKKGIKILFPFFLISLLFSAFSWNKEIGVVFGSITISALLFIFLIILINLDRKKNPADKEGEIEKN